MRLLLTSSTKGDLCRTHAVEWQGMVETEARSLDFSGKMITAAFEKVKELPGAPSVSSAYGDRLHKGKRLYSVTPFVTEERSHSRNHQEEVDYRTLKRVVSESQEWRRL